MDDQKTIKINLKQTIEDMVFAIACRDSKELKRIKNNFEEVYKYQSGEIRQGITKYLLGNTVVTSDEALSKYFIGFLNQK